MVCRWMYSIEVMIRQLRTKVVVCHLPGAEAGRKLPCDDNLGTGVGVEPSWALIGPQSRSRLRDAALLAGLGLRNRQLASLHFVCDLMIFDFHLIPAVTILFMSKM